MIKNSLSLIAVCLLGVFIKTSFSPILVQKKAFTKTWENVKLNDTGNSGWVLETAIQVSVSFQEDASGQINYCRDVEVAPKRIIDPEGTTYTNEDINPKLFETLKIEFNAVNANLSLNNEVLTPFTVMYGTVTEAEPSKACRQKSKLLWYESAHPKQKMLGSGQKENIYALYDSDFTLEFTDVEAKFQNKAKRDILMLWYKKGLNELSQGNCADALKSFNYYINIGGSEQFVSNDIEKAKSCK